MFTHVVTPLQYHEIVDKCQVLEPSARGLVLLVDLRQRGIVGPGRCPYRISGVSISVEAPWSPTDGSSRQHTV